MIVRTAQQEDIEQLKKLAEKHGLNLPEEGYIIVSDVNGDIDAFAVLRNVVMIEPFISEKVFSGLRLWEYIKEKTAESGIKILRCNARHKNLFERLGFYEVFQEETQIEINFYKKRRKMKKLLMLFLLVTGLAFSQTSNNVIIESKIKGDSTHSDLGSASTIPFNKFYGYDLIGIYYPKMDSSSQFKFKGKIKLGHNLYSDTINVSYKDSAVTVFIKADSTKPGYISFDKFRMEMLDQVWIQTADTVKHDKTFYWIMQERKK